MREYFLSITILKTATTLWSLRGLANIRLWTKSLIYVALPKNEQAIISGNLPY
jgi:hypothetical protein